jgi:hypothetical protein
MEDKWFMIMIAIAVVAIMAGAGIVGYNTQQCRIEVAKTNRPVAEIMEICK